MNCNELEYIELEYMIDEMAKSENTKEDFFMSHYVVVKHESLITKSIFDALAKISIGILLNDVLMMVQCYKMIFSILIRFRLYSYM